MIYVLYSSDYELFLGGNYRPESEVLIDTTEQLLRICEAIGVPMTLFCDLPCLWRYRELGHQQFPDLVDNQLKHALAKGHDVQAHIHPHWAKTEIIYNEDGSCKYNFDLSKFLLGNWIPEGGTASRNFCADIFKRAKLYLENLLQPVNSSYRCVAYRAGGYGVQPNTREIFEALLEAGYLIDSSIVPGRLLDSNVNRIDFSKVPRQGNYFISPELGLNKVSEEGVFEVPILALRSGEAGYFLCKSYSREAMKYIDKRVTHKSSDHATLKPLGYTIQSTKRRTLLTKVLAKIDAILNGGWALDLIPDVDIMVDATKKYIDYCSSDEKDLYFSFICHSKNVNSILLDSFKKYHSHLQNIYGKQLKAITFQQAASNLTLT